MFKSKSYTIRAKKRTTGTSRASGADGAARSISNIRENAPTSCVGKRRSYRFTLNNYTTEDPAQLEQTFLKMSAKKFVFQEEIGEIQKTPHLQGCVFFTNSIGFNTMKKINPRIAWFKLDYPKKAIAYCLKSDTRKENGRQWFHGIDPIDFEEKAKIPLIPHHEMIADMTAQMIAEGKEDLKKELDRIEKENLWTSPNYGYGEN